MPGSVQEIWADHVVLLMCAALLNVLLGGPRNLWIKLHIDAPAVWISHLLRNLERKLNRERRSQQERFARGSLFAISVCLLAGTFGLMLSYMPAVMQMAVIAYLLPLRQTVERVLMLQRELRAEKIEAARECLAGTPWRNRSLLDGFGLVRAGLETLAMQSCGFISAAMALVLLGLPGLFVSRALFLLAELAGPQSPLPGEHGFGTMATRLHGWLHLLPGLISGIALMLAAWCVPLGNGKHAFTAWAVSLRANPARLVWFCPLFTFSGATQVTLGGPASCYVQGGWIGTYTLQPRPSALQTAMWLFIAACAICLLLLASLLL